MRSAAVIRLIAARELLERGRMRSFKVTTAILAVLLLAVVLVPRLLDSGPASYDVGVVGAVEPSLRETVEGLAATVGADVAVTEVTDAGAGESALREGDLDVLVVGAQEVVVQEEVDPESRLATVVAGLSRSIGLTARLEQAGLAPDEATAAVTAPGLAVRDLGMGEGDDEERPVILAGVILLYLFLLSFGSIIATGVVEEKASRVVEVVLSAVRPHQLLAGKVLGIGALGLVQVVLVATPALVVAVAGGTDLPSGTPLTVASLVLWFVLGYALYSCAYATAASLVSRVEDAQNASFPVTMGLLVGYGATIAAGVSPDGILARVLALLPPTAPLVMPTRAALGDAAPWEVPLAVVLSLAAIYGLVHLAGWVYSGAALRFGTRVPLREALRAGRAARSSG